MANGEGSMKLAAEPLYRQAADLMIRNIASGIWAPGMRLPNEFDLAEEFGVSQGTIRKALGALEARGLLTRAPGRGTVVARTTEEEALFAFFRMRDDKGRMLVPEPLSETLAFSTPTEADHALWPGEERLFHIRRVRQARGAPLALELIWLPVGRLAGGSPGGAFTLPEGPLPNSLYPYFQDRFGLSITAMDEALAAVCATSEQAQALGVAAATPLLEVRRTSFDPAGDPVERRLSYYLTDAGRYAVSLSR
ncbi:GntR family transcriptional regulator [Oceanomicrobium pacificus]|uniref:UTRA domain-containing protein n=1 Tax=Oceanomicrobium pacificus TaxID=2692916 RepID=A0A6B0TSX7_9RHOB|nr:GntR family transcriptional regulator [Oceanomicrobium pacificus]MXU64778.1 UTRA domain-containing protein [Oceanomicrobium pacificus]